ncbi:MAG: butyrate kinase [bacterium]
MTKRFRILSINPGSTTTKYAVFDNEEPILQETVTHSAEDLAPFPKLIDELDFRLSAILAALAAGGIELTSLDAVAARGGDLGPIPSGTYAVNATMVEKSRPGGHASNLGPVIADKLSQQLGIPAYVTDPVTVDEYEDIARPSGWPELPRRSGYHALNQKAIARKAAKDLSRLYEDLNLIVVHMGGGISVGAHRKGRVIDVNIEEGGLFTPERAVPPIHSLVRLCFSGEYTEGQVMRKLFGEGGIYAYIGTKDAREVEKMIAEGNEQAKLLYAAMAYQVGKAVGAIAVVLRGEIDAIALTGGIAYSEMFTSLVKDKISFLAPVLVYPGEKELESLALGALRVLRGEEKALEYDFDFLRQPDEA